MKIAIYGGSFNPPHLGHSDAVETVMRQLSPDKMLIIPNNDQPNKDAEEDEPRPEERLRLCELSFGCLDGVEVSNIELKRGGKSYTADTVEKLREQYPDDELMLVIGGDMLYIFDDWYRYDYILQNCELVVLRRCDDDAERLEQCADRLRNQDNAKITLLEHEPVDLSSTQVRDRLRIRLGSDMLKDDVYSEIIRRGYYGALPELSWLREKTMDYLSSERIAHVAGCENEAVMLAVNWGEDPESAATAGILHDISKKYNDDEQLKLCDKYGIILDDAEKANGRLLHARTGAAMARELFGVSDEIYNAIRWHTTGKPDMTTLEKIIYLADFTEPNRDFPGLDELRELCYRDLNDAMARALEMSLESIRRRNIEPYKDTLEACLWYNCQAKDRAY